MQRAHDDGSEGSPRLGLLRSHLLAVSGALPEGAEVLSEVAPRYAPHVLRAVRLVLAWSRGSDASAALFEQFDAGAWEAELLRDPFEDELWAPLYSIATEMRAPDQVDVKELVRACMCVVEWALGNRAPDTAMLMAQAAASAFSDNAALGCVVGRLLRTGGRLPEAELWLLRAERVAVRRQEWDTQALALNSLGNLYVQQGAMKEARRLLERTLFLARRKHLREREGKVLHDLFVLLAMTGEHQKAEQYGILAFESYGPGHEDLPKLAHDIAHLWSEQGEYTRALPVFQALLRHFESDEERLRVLVSVARAAGGCGASAVFDEAAAEAERLFGSPDTDPVLAESALELALGATSLQRWSQARHALAIALEASRRRGEHEATVRAVAAAERVDREEHADRAPRQRGRAVRPADRLAENLVETLEAQVGMLRLQR